MSSATIGYRIERALGPATWLARRTAGERVLLKRMPDDCLRKGELHPAIALRLTRLRELPLRQFVNLIGVDRHDGQVVLVSEYVEGKTIAQRSNSARENAIGEHSIREHSGGEHPESWREQLQQIVSDLHRLGFVHGNIHERNVVISDDGRITLIDPSPLLHEDPSADLVALRSLGVIAKTDPIPVSGEIDSHRPGLSAAILVSLSGIVIAGAVFALTRSL